MLPPDFVLPRNHNFSANDVARPRVPEAFFGETEGNDKVLPVPYPNSRLFSGERTEQDSSEECSADDVECLVRVALETLPNLRKLENVEDFGDFKGNWAAELPLEVLSTVDCLTGIFGKVTADAVAKELVVVDRLKPADWIRGSGRD